MTLLQRLNRFPPILCRLVARKNHGNRAKSCREIARQAKLSRKRVEHLSRRTSWAGVPVDVAARFAAACGVDLLHPRRQIDFLKRKSKAHWQDNPVYYAGLLKLLKSAKERESKLHADQA